jgi:hypothetical protein
VPSKKDFVEIIYNLNYSRVKRTTSENMNPFFLTPVPDRVYLVVNFPAKQPI